MNKLSTAKQVQILNMLVEGMYMRATSRVDARAPKPNRPKTYRKRPISK